jgi:DNA-binding response OmpR family regulator
MRQPPPSPGPPILLVEDDPAYADTLLELLRAQGYAVDHIADGAGVLGRLREGNYGMLILDVLLPHVSGFALLQQIRAEPALAALPIVMISGIYRSRNHRTQLLADFGLLDYLDKPLSFQRLLEVVQGGAGQPGDAKAAPSPAPTAPDDFVRARTTPLRRPDPAELAPIPDSLVDLEANQERRQVESAARRQFKPSVFVTQGTLEATPVAPLLGKLWQARATGALLLRHEGVKKIVYLRDGSPYTVKSNLVSECLGPILVAERLITREECEASVLRMRESGKRQGEILVRELRAITIQNLTFGLQTQLEHKLFSTFDWDHGDYRFNPSAPLADAVVDLQWQAPRLIIEGIRRALDETAIRARLLDVLDVPVSWRLPGPELSSLDLTPHETQALMSGQMPDAPRRLLESLPLPPHDTLRLLYSLIALEILVPASSA